MRIAFLGPEGTFTQEAALKHFGSSVSSEPMETIDDVFFDGLLKELRLRGLFR